MSFGTHRDRVRQAMATAVANAQKRVLYTLLPDTCTIRPHVDDASYTIDRHGIATWDTPENRTYLDSENIPCRADHVRAFRPEELDFQATQVDEVELHLPHDLIVEEEDIVTLRGNEYRIRQLIDDSEYEVTKIAKIMRIATELGE